MGFLGGSDSTESACHAGDLSSIPGLGRSPGGKRGNPTQYSCLVYPHGQKSLAGYSPWGHKELDMTEQLSMTQYSTVYLRHIFIYLSTDGHLSCFHTLAKGSDAAMNIGMHVSFLASVLGSFLNICLGMELLGFMIVLFLVV